MTNVYIDPSSYIFLNNGLFEKLPFDHEDRLLIWRYLKDYCRDKDINFKTIDLRNKGKKEDDDVYVSFDHKNILTRIYWMIKNRNYPVFGLNNFKKKILFQMEPPTVMPAVFKKIDRLLKIYDEIFCTSKTNNPKVKYIRIARPYNLVLEKLWENKNRKFLVMININKKPRFFTNFKRQNEKNINLMERALFAERIKAIEFFRKINGFDLYGWGWDKNLPRALRRIETEVKRIYRGPLEFKYPKLSEYNFAIAFENNITPGFIGEALFDCFYTGTIPIYLGAPDIQDYIPRDCFIDMRDFKNYKELNHFLHSLNGSDIEKYRENARTFLMSDKFKPFSKEYFAELFVNVVLN